MTFFDQILNKIFSRQYPKGFMVRESLKRSAKETADYENWISENGHIRLIKAVSQAYFYKKTQIISPIQIHLFESVGASGFAIKYDPTIGKDNFMHLFDYFKNKVLELDYSLQIAELRMTDKNTHVELLQKYYLKPKMRNALLNQHIINQQYGNILIEYICIDELPGYIKFLVTYYQDRLFTVPKDYDELINCLFTF